MSGETRGNIAAGGRGETRKLTENDLRIAHIIGPVLKKKGLHFVGIDVIGDYVTEINVTSPTCVREDRKSTRLNSSHVRISYAVFCLKKKKTQKHNPSNASRS